jgi:lysophospholipase L1-like esterase
LRFARYDLADGSHSLRIEPGGDGAVYLYGVVIERTKPGVLVDQMGIPGMRGNIILHWQETPWRAQMARRSPDLVILAYGVNSVAEKNEPMWRFRENWRRVLERVRTAAPKAACMIIGPTDWPLKPDETGVRNHRPRIDAVIAVQKRVAAEYGCAFWDAFAAMGGSGSMVRWVANGLAGRDHVHLTRSGYELLADRLTRDLLNGYSVVSR